MSRTRGAGLALLLVALNLRIAIAAVPPVLGQIRHATGLSSAGGGLLTALPVFCFGAAAFGTPWLLRRLRMAPLLSLTMLAVAAGSALRLASPLLALFLGTAVIGTGIAIGNVLLPSLIKRDFPGRLVGMTSLYSVMLCISAAIPAGLTVPIERLLGSGWRIPVAVWGAVALLALLIWIPYTRRGQPDRADRGEPPVSGLWRDPIAWCVTGFMGLQSFGFYATLSWIPTIYESHGVAPAVAGGLLSYSIFPGMLAALVTPVAERRTSHPFGFVILSVGLSAAAYAGLLADGSGMPYLWMTLLGLGQGASLSLALGFIVKRSPDTQHAAKLSTMAQGVGYLIASGGPFAVGALHGIDSSWTLPLVMLLVVLVAQAVSGLGAGGDRHVRGATARLELDAQVAAGG